MKKSTLEKVMDAVVSLWKEGRSFNTYGPAVVKRSGMSSSAVYGALSELTIHKMLEHNYHGGPYRPTDKSISLLSEGTPSSAIPSAPRGGSGGGAGSEGVDRG